MNWASLFVIPEPWTIESFLIFLLLALLAEILGTVGAFGSSVFFVPLASFYMDFHSALGLTAIFHVASNLSKIAFFKNGINKDLLRYLGLPAIVAVIFGALITSFLPVELLKTGLGILLVSLSLLFIIYPKLRMKPSPGNAMVGGLLSGGLAGVVGTGGPIRGLTLAAFNLSKEVFIATSAFIDLGVDLSRSIVYSSQGFFTLEMVFFIPFLIAVSMLGTYIGKRILAKIPQHRFNYIVLSLIFFIGLYMLLEPFLVGE